MSEERTLAALHAAVKALPGAPERAGQVFELVTTDDPGMADGWLGRVATGDRSLATLEKLAATAPRVGTDLRSLRLNPHDVGAEFDTDYARLPIVDETTARLAYIAALIDRKRYADADALLQPLPPSIPVAYVKAVLSKRSERWPDVLAATAGSSAWLDQVLRRASALLEAWAAANLGLFDRGLQAADRAVGSSDDEITRDAQFCRALMLRHQGDAAGAQAALTDIRVRWPDFVRAQEALADDTFGFDVTDSTTIDTRTDKWDAASGTTAEQRAAQETATSARHLLAEAEQELSAMIGLTQVKARIHTLRADSIARTLRQRRGLPTPPTSRHLLMVGPPGVGKTVSARTISKTFCGLGVIPRPDVYETKKSELVGRHLGDAENNTRELLEKAVGATVFIDEFGDLVGQGYSGGDAYGLAIVGTLLPWMENERANSIVIGAGYPRACQRVLAANDGLRSRFSTIIEYHSYTPDELIAISEAVADASGDTIEAGATEQVLREPFTRFYTTEQQTGDGDVIRQIDLLGNARFVRTIIERAQEARNLRLVNSHGLALLDLADDQVGAGLDNDTLVELTTADLHAGYLEALALNTS